MTSSRRCWRPSTESRRDRRHRRQSRAADFRQHDRGTGRCGARAITAQRVYDVFTSTMNDKAMQAVEKEMAPVLAAFSDEIIQNARCSRASRRSTRRARPAADARAAAPGLGRSIAASRARARRSDAADKTRLAGDQPAPGDALYTHFSQNVLADEEEHSLVLDSEADLAGLSAHATSSSADGAAEAKGLRTASG